MKKYTSLGELLIDYRLYNDVSQIDLAAKMNVDVRTIIRWEANQSLIKAEKEKELLEQTFIPFQLIRNLNSAISIPTYYDFALRKYALAEISIKLPSALWIKEQMNHPTGRIRSIESKSDIDHILRYSGLRGNNTNSVSRQLIEEAAKLLPELNLIIFDKAGYYSGHCVILPIEPSCYQQLREQSIKENQITVENLTNYRNSDIAVFHFFEVTADCNENVFYLVGAILKFFNDKKALNYLASSITTRHDSYCINEQLGMNLIWENKPEKGEGENIPHPRFYEGDFNAFLNK
jgi:transcriptional regulator with XRE-family HTH domain